MKHHRLNHC
uniref:Uncharacterized protein MANES_01G229100 n=1 Tax=Rhizophora mucronata TaxID=61149 RepID=A0A2P2KFQ9_RHIMU